MSFLIQTQLEYSDIAAVGHILGKKLSCRFHREPYQKAQ